MLRLHKDKKRFLVITIAILLVILCVNFITTPLTVYSWNVGESKKIIAKLSFEDGCWQIELNGCGAMKNLTTTSIQYAWYSDIYNLTTGWTIPVGRVIVNEGITSISAAAFSDFQRLTEVVLPSSLTSIEESAFRNCPNLLQVSFRGTVEQWNTIRMGENWNKSSCIKYIYCSDGIVNLQ